MRAAEDEAWFTSTLAKSNTEYLYSPECVEGVFSEVQVRE